MTVGEAVGEKTTLQVDERLQALREEIHPCSHTL